MGEDAGVGNSAGQDSQSSDTTGGRDPAKKKGANVAVLVSLIVVALIAFAVYAFWNKFTDQDGNIAITKKYAPLNELKYRSHRHFIMRSRSRSDGALVRWLRHPLRVEQPARAS